MTLILKNYVPGSIPDNKISSLLERLLPWLDVMAVRGAGNL